MCASGLLDPRFSPASFLQHSSPLAHHVEATVQLLLTGGFVGIVPDHIAQPWVSSGELYRLPLSEFVVDRPVFAVARESEHRTRTAMLMQDALIEAFGKGYRGQDGVS
ncbi:hypothetical protein CUU62_23090 [Pseudomonas sp. WP001]|nr:hypothetical protein CUU62_23090 [Pseudomonas sp. WP001]